MAKLAIKPGATSQTVYVLVADSASTTGGLKTGITFNAAGFTAYYVRVAGSATAITKATQTVTGAWSSGGWVEVDATNCPGLYRFDVPDAVIATGSRSAIVYFRGASGMVETPLEIDLSNQADAVSVSGTGLTARDLGASVLLAVGTGTGQVNLTSGKVPATLTAGDVSGALPGNVMQVTGSLVPTTSVSGVLKVDVAYVNGIAATAMSGAIDANVTEWDGTAVAAPILGTVVSATTASVVLSYLGGPVFNATANAYGGGTAIPAHYLKFTSGTNDGMEVTITGSSVSGGNLTVTFAATTGVVAATAGNTVQID